MLSIFHRLAFLVPLLVLSACSGDDDGGDGGSDDDGGGGGAACEELAATVCPPACDCSPDGCWLRATSDTQGVERINYGPTCEDGFVREVCGDASKPASLIADCLAAVTPPPEACMEEDGDLLYWLPPACHGILD